MTDLFALDSRRRMSYRRDAEKEQISRERSKVPINLCILVREQGVGKDC